MAAPRDLYAVLGVPKSATADELKQAYRKLARKFHPDVNPGNKEAEEKFKEVNGAFEVLSDPGRRSMYDEFGPDALRLGFDPEKARQYRQWQSSRASGRGPAEFSGFDFGENVDLSDLFGSLFGGAGRARQARAAARPGDDLVLEVEVSLREVVKGGERPIRFPRQARCDQCHGSGSNAAAARTCPTCLGSGRARTARGFGGFAGACATCSGTGKIGDTCPRCQGSGLTPEEARITVRIPPGVEEGSRIRVAGQGSAGARGGPPGDLYLLARVQSHPLIRRDGRDLYLPLPITAGEALRGGEVRCPTFDGDVTLTIPKGSQSGRKLRLRGLGVPPLKGGSRGDLYAELHIVLPGDSEEVRQAVGTLDRAYAGDVRAVMHL